MILSNIILKADIMLIYYIYKKLISINKRYKFLEYLLYLGGINKNDKRNINIYYNNYEMNAELYYIFSRIKIYNIIV